MKLDGRQAETFLREPGSAKVVLLHGEDVGLIRERARTLVTSVAGGTDDPFRVVELEKEHWDSIPAEMASLPLTGGRRVVRVREAADAIAEMVKRVLEDRSEGLLVLEAPGLGKGKLRDLVEKSVKGAALACYPLEGRALGEQIRGVLAERKVGIDNDALDWLVEHLGADQAVTRAEVEKLALYVGEGGRVGLEEARASVGDLAGLSLEDALYAATSGDVAGADRALELAIAEGSNPVAILRAGLIHMQRLQRARAAMDGGASAGEAVKSLRPPLFFKRERVFTAALGRWSSEAIAQACRRLWETELACKKTGAPDDALARSTVLGLALRAARR